MLIRPLLGMTFVVGVLASGCATPAARANLVRQRASFDLNCPEPITIFDLGNGNAFGASGCGRRASYVVSCKDYSNKSTCTAIMNSDEKTTAQTRQ